MRGLFSRFFFSFLLIMVVAGAISALAVYTLGRVSFESFRQDLFREYGQSIARFIVVSGQAAHDTYRYSGIEAYRSYVREFEAGTGTRLILIAGDDKGLAGEPVPAELQAVVAAARSGKGLQIADREGELLVAGTLAGKNGERFVAAGVHRKRPPPRGVGAAGGPGAAGRFVDIPPPAMPGIPGPRPLLPQWPGLAIGLPGGIVPFFVHGGGAVRLLVAVLVAAGVCLLLARSFSAPLARLRRVTRQIAAGDFSARVGDGLGRTAEEIAGLGRDFDTMAAATEKMILSRQRLLRDISHELRSPLARLNVALELARQRFNAHQDGALAVIDKESNRLNELIEHLLRLTRLEDGEALGERQPVELKDLILRIAADANFESRAAGRGVAIRGLEDLRVDGSAELLHRAIENVVRNAARYTAERTEAEVSLNRRQGLAVLEVADHGPGVPASDLEAIFQPFYRVAAARDRQSGGTGLGLAIAAETVKRHGGRIEAVNGAAGGLAVRIFLPVSETGAACGRQWEKGSQSGQRIG